MKRIALLLSAVCLVARAQIPPSIGTLVSTTIILDESQYVGKPCTLYAHNYQNPLTGHLLYCSAIGLNFNISVVGTWAILNTGGGGSVAWGSILGTLSNQTDLQAALNAKQNTGNYITALTGDATASGPGSAALTLTTVNSNVGACGDATHTSQITLDAKGRATGCTPVSITATSGITALTGDVTATGPGSAAATLAAVGSAGSCGDSTHSCQLTFDTKGRETARANVAIAGAGSTATAIQTSTFASPPTAAGAAGIFYDTSGANNGLPFYYSTASGTTNYLQLLVAGPSGALSFGTGGGATNAIDIDTNVVCRLTNSCSISALWGFAIGQDFTEQASGSTPGSGKLHIYANTDHTFHQVTSGGVDTALGGGGGFTKSWIRATQSTGQVIPNNAGTALVWDTNDAHNTGSLFTHSTSSNTERVVAASSTYAHGVCQVSASTGALGNVWKVSVTQVVSGTPIDISQSDQAYSAEIQQNISFSTYILAGDYVQCGVFQNTGATAPLTAVSSFVVEN